MCAGPAQISVWEVVCEEERTSERMLISQNTAETVQFCRASDDYGLAYQLCVLAPLWRRVYVKLRTRLQSEAESSVEMPQSWCAEREREKMRERERNKTKKLAEGINEPTTNYSQRLGQSLDYGVAGVCFPSPASGLINSTVTVSFEVCDKVMLGLLLHQPCVGCM